MWNKLKPREKRILKLLLATAVLIFGYMLIEPIWKDYQQVKAERLQLQETVDDFRSIQAGDSVRQQAIARRVPVFKMPVKAAQQSVLFRDEITKQLRQCGMKAKSMKLRQNKTKKVDGYKVWTVECQGQGQYGRGKDQFQGGRQSLGDQILNRSLQSIGNAEVAMGGLS